MSPVFTVGCAGGKDAGPWNLPEFICEELNIGAVEAARSLEIDGIWSASCFISSVTEKNGIQFLNSWPLLLVSASIATRAFFESFTAGSKTLSRLPLEVCNAHVPRAAVFYPSTLGELAAECSQLRWTARRPAAGVCRLSVPLIPIYPVQRDPRDYILEPHASCGELGHSKRLSELVIEGE